MSRNSEMTEATIQNPALIGAKISFDGMVRRFSFDRKTTFSELWDTILKLCNIEQQSNVKLRYADDENDFVVLSSDLELREAIRIFDYSFAKNTPILHLQLNSPANEKTNEASQLNVPKGNENLPYAVERIAVKQRIRETRKQCKKKSREFRHGLCKQRPVEKRKLKQQIKEARKKFKQQKRELKLRFLQTHQATLETRCVLNELQQLSLSPENPLSGGSSRVQNPTVLVDQSMASSH